MAHEAGAGSVRVMKASVEVVRTMVARRSLVFAFPATMEEGRVEAIARTLLVERASGFEVTKHSSEGYVVDSRVTDRIVTMEPLSATKAVGLIEVFLEADSSGRVLAKRLHHYDEVFVPSPSTVAPLPRTEEP